MVIVVSTIIEYFIIMVKSRKEKVILGIVTLLTILFGAITIILFYVFNILTLFRSALRSILFALIVQRKLLVFFVW